MNESISKTKNGSFAVMPLSRALRHKDRFLRSIDWHFGGLVAVEDFNIAVGRTEICGLIGPGAARLFSTHKSLSADERSDLA